MKVFIRTDASVYIGTGHVMRCLVLARALQQHHFSVTFVCRPQNGDLIKYIKRQGIHVQSLPQVAVVTPQHSADYAAWLQCTWQQDAIDFIAAVKHADVVITDHYAIDYQWQKYVKEQLGCTLLAIDDLNRIHFSDLIIDQNLWPDLPQRYSDCSQKKLLGPQYALLDKPFSDLINKNIKKKNQVLAFFGGNDLSKECIKLFHAACSYNSLPFQLKIVTGQTNQAYQQLINLPSPSHVSVVKFIDKFALELKQTNYVIGASGVSNWERFCLNIPATIVSVAENQLKLSQYLAQLEVVRYLGESQYTDIQTYVNELQFIISCWPGIRFNSSLNIDGHGTERIVSELKEQLKNE
tara:strand:- start:1959 stop:3014 length:1056 start_codon:yes stop_codon:yes gene_type:complete